MNISESSKSNHLDNLPKLVLPRLDPRVGGLSKSLAGLCEAAAYSKANNTRAHAHTHTNMSMAIFMVVSMSRHPVYVISLRHQMQSASTTLTHLRNVMHFVYFFQARNLFVWIGLRFKGFVFATIFPLLLTWVCNFVLIFFHTPSHILFNIYAMTGH